MESHKFFAVIPAAGHSLRMGQPKLLMAWKDERVIDAVLQAWTTSSVDRVVLVVREDDQELIEACRMWPVEIVALSHPTEDMKDTVIEGLNRVTELFSPRDEDQVLIAPADIPRISKNVIDVVANVPVFDQIVVPHFGEKPGHPVRIPWSLTSGIHSLSAVQGLDVLINSSQIYRVDIEPGLRSQDIDTLDDYKRELNL